MRLTICVLVVAIVSVATAAPFAPNLLPDPGFEDKSGWQLTTWEVCEYQSEVVADAHSGQVAAKLSALKPGKGGRISAIAISRPVAVRGGQPYLLALWYRTDPGVTAAVSVITYRQPFTTAQFKTPTTSYNTYALPPSASWRLWTMRLQTPQEAVEAVVMPRMQMVGTGWFDDVSLLPADQALIRLEVPGTITKLPDTRLYKGSLTLPEGAALQLAVIPPGAPQPTQTVAAGKSFSFTSRVPAGEPAQAVLIEPQTHSVVAVAELPAPPPVALELTRPGYRRTVYAGQDSRVTATLRPHVSAGLRQRMTYAVRLKRPDGTLTKPQAGAWQTKPSGDAEGPISLSLGPSPAPGNYALRVAVTGAGAPQTFAEPLAVVGPPPAGVHAFIVGPNGTLLMDGKPFFPRGFMGGGPEVYEPVVKAGYNIASTFGGTVDSQLRWLDGLQTLGMYGVTGFAETFVDKHDLAGLREGVRQIRNHPALLGYYFPDEPSPTRAGASPADWQPYYDLMVQEDPYHPVMTTMYDAEFADDYAPVLDILLFDPYPITKVRKPITMVSDFILRARELVQDRKPVWLVPQAFGYDVVTGMDKEPTWTTPTPEQERCMTYLGLATGARGLLYYCYHVYTAYDAAKKAAGGWPWTLGGYLPDKQPQLWASLAKIGEEARLLAPALDRPSRMWQQNGIFLREIPPAGDEAGFLIGVNPSDTDTIEATVKLQTRLPSLPELEELARRTPCVNVAGSQAQLTLPPLGVGIWKLPGHGQ